MTSKRVTVEGLGVKLSSDAALKSWCDRKGVRCLIDSDGDEIVDFESIVDGGAYTLAPQPLKKVTIGGSGVKLSSDAALKSWCDRKGVRCLIDSDGDEIVGFESIVDGGAYTLGPQRPSTVPDEFKPALLFAQQQLEAKTEHKGMSVASYDFAQHLLRGMNVLVEVDVPNLERGSTMDPSPYSWTVETKDNEIMKIGEHQGTPGARSWFLESFLGKAPTFCLHNVTGRFLPTIKGNQKSAAGKGDLVIGKEAQLEVSDSPYEQAYGLVELKTGEYPIKSGQNVLELTSLSTISRLGRCVALLATDCNAKWELCYFKDRNTIQRRAYKHGRKCWEDFNSLLESAESRIIEPPVSRYKPTLEEEDEQNLDGFDISGEEDGKLKAVERHAMLNNLANQLAEIYGERPVVPQWARSEATDYFA